jgi:VanZ family protein
MPHFPPHRTLRLRRWAAHARTLAAFYVVVLFIGTHIPLPPEAMEVIGGKDRLAHFAGYAVLTFVVLAGWELTIGRLKPKHYFAVWLAGILYGAFDETTQTYVGRICDLNDWVADLLGIVAGLLLFRAASALLRRLFVLDDAAPTVGSQAR